MLSNEDIKRAIRRKDIVIEPFDEKDEMTADSLTNVGFDIRAGDVVISLTSERGILPVESGPGPFFEGFWIEPFESVLVLTREYVQVSHRIGGTFHTRVTLIARGFSPISTTLDPGWHGHLFITITNLRNHRIFLGKGEKLTTLVFYQVRRRATLVAPNQNNKLEHITSRLTAEAGLNAHVLEGILKLKVIAKQSEQDHIIQEKNSRERRRLQIRRASALALLATVTISLGVAYVLVPSNDSTGARVAFLVAIAASVAVIAQLLYQNA